jgi:hypothetical protein
VDNTHISDEITAIFAHNHELTFPKLLVIGDLVVVGFTFTYFENTLISFEREGEIFKLFSIN